MDRLNRMLQAAQGMGMGSAAPGGVRHPVVSMILPCDHLSRLLSLLPESHAANRSSLGHSKPHR